MTTKTASKPAEALKTLSIEEMRGLVTYRSAWFQRQDKQNSRGYIHTAEGRWEWNEEKGCYLLVQPK